MRRTLNLIFLIAIAIASLVPAHAEEGAEQPVININTATAEQLALLPRVGPKVAQRIIDWREQHGPFVKSTDLLQVRGIGAKSYELLEKYIVVEGETTLSTKQRVPRKPRPANTAE